MRTLDPALRRYVALVSGAGGASLLVLLARLDWMTLEHTPALWLLVALVVGIEWIPVRVPFRGGAQEITLSTTFAFALLAYAGTPVAVASQAVASVLPDLAQRKPWWKVTFNVGQYTLAVAAAGVVLDVLDGGRRGVELLTPSGLLVMLLAGAAFYVVNNGLTASAVGMGSGVSPLVVLGNDFLFQATTAFVLLSQAPLVLLAVDRGLWFVPMFFPAIVAVYRAAHASVQRDHQALYDALTDLPNRTHFQDRIERMLAERAGPFVAVLHVDLDNFREVNNTLGHDMGDRLLQQIGLRLQDALRDVGSVARLGADEFGVVAALAERDDALRVGATVREALTQPFDLDGLPFEIEASIGAAVHPDHGSDPSALIRRADIAMHVAKERRSGLEVYNRAHDRHDPRRLALLGELRHAIEHRQLVVYFQPQADIRTGAIVGTEALVRWQHPEHGLVPPDEFIPLAEATGLIGPLTMFVLDEALGQLRRWRETGLDLTVSVNVSARNLHDPELPSIVAALLERHRVPPGALDVEVTESTAMADPALAQEVLGRIHALGVTVAVDDFGTGHSSLAYLKRLPVDTIKVDKSFVIGMLTAEDDATIVASTVELGHSLGLRVVAEGVESEAVLRRLAGYGCDVAQGYYLSRPLPADKFTAWLLGAAAAAPVRPVLTAVPAPGAGGA